MEIILYAAEDGKTRLEVHMARETVWLSQRQMSDFFDKDTDIIVLHIRNIYKEEELTREGTTEESSVVQNEGWRQIRRQTHFYPNLTVKKVPKRVLSRCEWGHDDDSLRVDNLPKPLLTPGQLRLFDSKGD
jgi:hypothetical protein